ncbi:glycosyltransferase family 4 protein [Flavobacterium sedimenticola]|uniref:Glycosyltransferase family 4 protein n=1 Tax=Flavobacterium sedimenticola TaxID=3043286 RepID=A0ABT6XN54_9FLAO|nr:glycosyltransferase family 4 protein [Flavobacterium sedimenticola]MDI9256114.1 glycosyltransferase family 4 protein [Flavobacterium sedimenticola]
MINILFIHQSAELYGSDRTLLLLLTKLDKSRFHPVVVLPETGPLQAELEKQNIKVVIAPVLKLYRKMFTIKNIALFLKQVRSALKTLKELDKTYHFDIIYSNTLAVLLGMIYAKKSGKKHLWHVHEIIVHPRLIAQTFPKLLKKYANTVVCNSNATRQNLVARIPDLAGKTVVIHNGLSPRKKEFIKVDKSQLGFRERDIIITLIGRISRLKGHKLLLEMYINHLANKENIKLLFIGSPVPGQEYYLEEIEQLIHTHHLGDDVKILPFTKELDAFFEVSDIIVVPSTEAESFGLVALEAMLSHKPVIGSNHGGLTEIIADNETGFLVTPNDSKALAKAIQKLTENEKLRMEFGEKGYQRAVSEFSEERYLNQFETLFERMR